MIGTVDPFGLISGAHDIPQMKYIKRYVLSTEDVKVHIFDPVHY